MKIFLLILFICLCRTNAIDEHFLHGIFYEVNDQTHLYYGSIDLDVSQIQILNSLKIDDVGNPKNRKYSVLPLTYNPRDELIYMAAPSTDNQTIISVVNATTGAFLRRLCLMKNEIISIQYDIFQNQFFAHVETNVLNSTQIIEIDTTSGSIKRTLATMNNVQPTDISSYCPICRKYFLMGIQNEKFVYIGVDSTDAGGISWQTPMNFRPMSIRFDYKTFTMYSAYINQTDDLISTLGIVNRTLGGISDIVGTISTDRNLIVTQLSAFDIDEKIYYASSISSWPYSLGMSYVNVNGSHTRNIPLFATEYYPYGFFVKQFVH